MVRRGLVLLCAVVPALAGCSPHLPPLALPSRSATAPPSLAVGPAPSEPLPAVPSPPSLSTPPSPTTPAGFAAGSAVSCAGRPGVARVVALLRTQGVLDGTTTVSVRVGPLCAGTWQYTVLAVPRREPLQVVSQGPPDALVLVAAGTDVCSDRVRGGAPPGILAAAHC